MPLLKFKIRKPLTGTKEFAINLSFFLLLVLLVLLFFLEVMLSSNSIKEHTAFLWFLPINLQPLKFKGFKVGYPNGKCTLLNKIHMDKRVYIRSFLYPFLYWFESSSLE